MTKLRNLIFSLFFISIFGSLSIFTANLQADDTPTATTETSTDTDVADVSISFGGRFGRGGGPYWWRRNERLRYNSRPYWRNHPRYYRYGYRNYYPRYRRNPYYYDPYYYYNDSPRIYFR